MSFDPHGTQAAIKSGQMVAPDQPTEEQRMRAARDFAAWHIGDPSWADAIIDAYKRPVRAAEFLAAEKAE